VLRLKRRILIGLLVSAGLFAGVVGSHLNGGHLAKSGPAVQHVAGDGGPVWPPLLSSSRA
jgi:hypothetical protein